MPWNGQSLAQVAVSRTDQGLEPSAGLRIVFFFLKLLGDY